MGEFIIIGIDLGTTYSCIAVWRNGHVEVIANEQGNRTTPSLVVFTSTERLVGDEARQKNGIDFKNVVSDVKRLIGRNFNDMEVQSDLRYWPFKVVNKQGKPYVQVEYKNEIKDFMPEEISAMILSKLKDYAQDYLGSENVVKDVVITVPAYFNDAQRRATKDAGRIAGLNVLQIINEPTAAALAYGLNKTIKGEENVLIVDIGGGTTDVSLLSINNGTFTVKATAGNAHLAGEDFTNQLLDYFVEEFKRKYDKDISTNLRSLNRLRRACERAKCILSSSFYASIEIEYLFDGIDFYSSITRAQFEELNSDLFEKILEPIERVLIDADLDKSDINEIVLVGGSTRIPKIQKLVSSYFDGKELRKTVNPDEAVACGAAIQAANILGDQSESIKNLNLYDVISLSLGVDNRGTTVDTLIKRNTHIPAEGKDIRITCHDGQTVIRFRVVQGERELVKDNTVLGEVVLEGITSAPRSETKVELTYKVDINGIIHVSAVELGTGLSREITILNNELSQEEIERLISEAEMYREEDRKARERIQSMNKLDDYARQLLKRLNNEKDRYKIKIEDEEKLRNIITTTIEWISNHHDASKEEYDEKRNELLNLASSFFK
ncbi:hsp71-like protein [Piromyces finnis]|uniref:Hsp71-like protein n=1 Tax=Piromyces finnis TaxID=1754191 RepID=A0A1Y1UWS4_9FUNG|nr:hsp71-like protein [Piromyces finnis]|eukprot:ORX41671.1 hsp71-like protein [Piromyces finnis]